MDEVKEHYLSINTKDSYSCIFYPLSIYKLKIAYKYIIKHHLPFSVVGNKTNIFGNFDRILIDLSLLRRKLKYQNKEIVVSSNVGLHYLAFELSKIGIETFCYYPFLPASIGGAIIQNAGIKGHSISDYLIEIKALNEKGNIEIINKDNLKFYYRFSSLKFRSVIILEAKFEKILNVASLDIRNKVMELREKQPKGHSMGSIFKNIDSKYAGKLIEDLGYKGKYMNGLFVSDKHANFILNVGQEDSNYIRKLISKIKLDALLKLNIRLESEVLEFI